MSFRTLEAALHCHQCLPLQGDEAISLPYEYNDSCCPLPHLVQFLQPEQAALVAMYSAYQPSTHYLRAPVSEVTVCSLLRRDSEQYDFVLEVESPPEEEPIVRPLQKPSRLGGELRRLLTEQISTTQATTKELLLMTAHRKIRFPYSPYYSISVGDKVIGELTWSGAKFTLVDSSRRPLLSVSFGHYYTDAGSPVQMKFSLAPSGLCLENTRPTWHDGMNTYILTFDRQRVTEKSVRNFLVRPEPNAPIIYQSGRVRGNRDRFVVDFGSPLSPLVAFSLSIATAISKFD